MKPAAKSMSEYETMKKRGQEIKGILFLSKSWQPNLDLQITFTRIFFADI